MGTSLSPSCRGPIQPFVMARESRRWPKSLTPAPRGESQNKPTAAALASAASWAAGEPAEGRSLTPAFQIKETLVIFNSSGRAERELHEAAHCGNARDLCWACWGAAPPLQLHCSEQESQGWLQASAGCGRCHLLGAHCVQASVPPEPWLATPGQVKATSSHEGTLPTHSKPPTWV